MNATVPAWQQIEKTDEGRTKVAREVAKVEFFPLPAPIDAEVDALLLEMMKGVKVLLTRRGFFEENGSEAGSPSALESLQHEAAMGQRELALSYTEPARPKSGKERTAFREGFSLHASLHLHANDREGLERLCVYAGRGVIANERLELLPDGSVSYRMNRPSPDGRSHLVCTPVHFLRRLASITLRPASTFSAFMESLDPTVVCAPASHRSPSLRKRPSHPRSRARSPSSPLRCGSGQGDISPLLGPTAKSARSAPTWMSPSKSWRAWGWLAAGHPGPRPATGPPQLRLAFPN